MSASALLWYNLTMAKEGVRKSVAETHDKPAEAGGHVADSQKVTAERALKLLKAGVEGEDARGKAKQEIAGEEIFDPERAYHNLEHALHVVKSYFGETMKVKLDDVHFKKFHGNMVGESTAEGSFIDPIMLMHPAMRLAHVIAHETAHDKKRVLNEGLVEGYVHLWFGHDGAEHTYEKSVGKFQEFAKRFDKKGDVKESTKRIYELYYSGHFEEIYEEYEKNHIAGLATEAEKDQAFAFFREVFPELHYVADKQPGYFNLKTFKNVPAKERKGEKKGEVVDLAAYRKKVAGVEEKVRRTGTEG